MAPPFDDAHSEKEREESKRGKKVKIMTVLSPGRTRP
jgi:hypothetical protein